MTASERWRIAIASSIGTSHLASGLPCQDFSALRLLSDGDEAVLVAVASDGAGSAERSEVGARLTGEGIIAQVEAHLGGGGRLADVNRAVVGRWIGVVAEELSACADREGRELRDFACTLLAALVGEQEAIFFQIGDGAIVASNGIDDGWSYVFWPQHGEFANSTNFVISPGAVDDLEFEFAARRVKELALFTDGIENLVLKRDPRSVHEPFFEKMLAPVRASQADGLDLALSEALARYLLLPIICERTDDDKTLILATRMAADDGDGQG